MPDDVIPAFSLLAPPSCYVHLPEARVHYCCLGKGAPLLLLHGLGSSLTNWFWVTPGLAIRHRLILVDLRGHGQSSLAYSSNYAIPRIAGDVLQVLDRLGIEKTHVLGLSLGGCVAISLAIGAAERVDRLVFVNTFARLRNRGSLGKRIQRLYAAGRDMDRLAQVVSTSLFADAERQMITYQRLRRNDLSAIRRTMLAIVRFNTLNQLYKVLNPTLILCGARDKTVPRRCADDVMNRFPNARRRIIADAGHALPYDQPDVFIDSVLDFLAPT